MKKTFHNLKKQAGFVLFFALLWVLAFKNAGAANWVKSFDLPGQVFEQLSIIKGTPDGGFIIAGNPTSSDGIRFMCFWETDERIVFSHLHELILSPGAFPGEIDSCKGGLKLVNSYKAQAI